MRFCILIPALNPCERLLGVMDALLAADHDLRIIVVNDGSESGCDEIFTKAASRSRSEILRHEKNLGKGAALRTGIRRFLESSAEAERLITADADGQHLPADILAVAAEAARCPSHLVLGCRSFSSQAPLRSRFGNELTRWVFRFFSGKLLPDTQTGLRAVPRGLLPRLLTVRACRYEFELEMLLLASRQGMILSVVPIQTVYLDGNAASHFHPLLDSFRVYSVFGRYLNPFIGREAAMLTTRL